MFLQKIPTKPKDNIDFRMALHGFLAEGTREQRNTFIEMCRICPPITFKTMFWTFQPRPDRGKKGNLPFITWDWQDKNIMQFNHSMLHGGKYQIKKSRDVGATWIILGCGLNLWLFTPNIMGLVTSRKEELVDKKGNPDCLYWKLDYMIERLPDWVIPDYHRAERHLENKWNGSVIDGEATVESVGKGGRRTWAFCDEFPAVKHSDAEAIERALTDTAGCRLFLGTSEYQSHPFSKMGRQEGVEKIALGWWLHPWKAKGLYWSPDINVIAIEDIDYYKRKAPKVFRKYKKDQEIRYSDLEQELLYTYPEKRISFIADGGDPNRAKWRSPWYDEQRKIRTELDCALNLDMNEIGAGDAVFTSATINQMIDKHVIKPISFGEIMHETIEDRVRSIRYFEGGKGRLKLWTKLNGYRLNQTHNYVLGCDISLGQGQSNSVCSIFDVDLRKKVGSWTDPHILPEQFAEQVYAIGRWVGGMSGIPYLIWEANGVGQVFGKRIRELGYGFIYRMTSEKRGYHQKTRTAGWVSSSNSKLELVTNYNAALTAVFRPNMKEKKFINPDLDALKECEDYIFNGSQIIPSKALDDSSGAKAAHGDRVIADALCNLAAIDQPRAAHRFAESVVGTIEWRKKQARRQEDQNQEKDPWLDL